MPQRNFEIEQCAGLLERDRRVSDDLRQRASAMLRKPCRRRRRTCARKHEKAAGAREKSVIDVSPLRDPGVTVLLDAAQHDEQAGRYADAAARLDQAIKLSPESPDLLQDRAELAVRLKDYATAERLAHQSWSLGPKLGPLCARNWQTIVEMRLQAGDEAGADTARKWVLQCHKAGIPRY